MEFIAQQVAISVQGNNRAARRRSMRLGGGISVIALAATLGGAPALAQVPSALVALSYTPADAYSEGFVTVGSAQTNTGADIDASLAFSTGSASVVGGDDLPNAAVVTGNALTAYATGNAQTNGVDLANIGVGSLSNGISVLAEQENTYSLTSFSGVGSLTNIMSDMVFDTLSAVDNNPVSGDSLTLADDLIAAQSTGNIELSAVTGVVPTDYASAGVAGSVGLGASSASTAGNIVIGSSQYNQSVNRGSFAIGALSSNNSSAVGLHVYTSGVGDPQSSALTEVQTGNVISSTFLGNSANNDIGVSLTAGTSTGAGMLDGALVVANQQENESPPVNGTANYPFLAETTNTSIFTNTYGGDGAPAFTLSGGSIVQNVNTISATATGNSAIGANGAAGNEISLGISLDGITPAGSMVNQINAVSFALTLGADLAVANYQTAGDVFVEAEATDNYIGSRIGNVTNSSVGVADNAINATATENNAGNLIATPTGAGVNLISGIAAIGNLQSTGDGSGAYVEGADIGSYLGDGDAQSATGSSLTMAGNSIAATAGGNQVNNGISLSASNIFAGPTGDLVGPAYTLTRSGDGVGGAQANAGLSINNQQFDVDSAGADAGVADARVGGGIYSASGVYNDTLGMTNNTVTAKAIGNSGTNSLVADGANGVIGTAAIISGQYNATTTNASIVSGGVFGDLESGGPGITNSSLLLSGSQVGVEAEDNNVSNILSVSGGQLTNVPGSTALYASVSGAADIVGEADLVINNSQSDVGLLAQAFGADIGVGARVNAYGGGSITNSSVVISGPTLGATEQALAIGQEAVNALDVSAGVNLSDTAGLVNVQVNSAGAYAGLTDAYVGIDVNNSSSAGSVGESSFVVGTGAIGGSNGNIIRALAYDNQANNSFSISTGGTLDLAANLGSVAGSSILTEPPFDTSFDELPPTGVEADYGLLNNQSSNANVTATIANSSMGVYLGYTGGAQSVTNATVLTQGNAIVASAFGNQAVNSGAISAGNLTAASFSVVGDVTNVQSNIGAVTAAISNTASYTNVSFETQVYGSLGVTGSSLGTNFNTVLTQSQQNEASNGLTITANNITDVAPTQVGEGIEGPFAINNLAFSTQNVQYAGANQTVTQINTGADVFDAGSLTSSSVGVNGNAFEALGLENNASNTIDFGGTSTVNSLDASAGVQNVQDADGALTVDLGQPAIAGVPAGPDVTLAAVPYMVALGNNSGSLSDGSLVVSGGALVFNLSGLTAEEINDFENIVQGGVLEGDDYTLAAGNTYTVTDDAILGGDGELYDGRSISVSSATDVDTLPGSAAIAGTLASPSVLADIAGDINLSTIGVNNNQFVASAVANNAVNSLNIAATTVNGGAAVPPGEAGGSASIDVVLASADYAVTNEQLFSAPVSASSFGEVGINPTGATSITSSSLDVSGNSLNATAEGNVADNTLTMTATSTTGGTPPTLALVSDQFGVGNVVATSGGFANSDGIGLLVTAPGAITDSTLTMDDNSNLALAVANDVTNVVSATATNLDTADDAPTNATADPLAANADVSLVNVQSATDDNEVSAEAISEVTNEDEDDDASTGLVGSAVDISGNTTVADAYSNRASNTLNMSATDSTATAALSNTQGNTNEVDAFATGNNSFVLNGSTDPNDPAAVNSSINVTYNTFQAQAVGNQANNALNAQTGATYGNQSGSNAGTDGADASATYALANNQGNTGNVTAQSYGVEDGLALNGNGSTVPVSGSTINVSYNKVTTAAFGNSATNTMGIAALNSGNATVALDNTQTNTGAVTSTIDGADFSTNIGAPGASGITSMVHGNSVGASAVGNAATNSVGIVP